VRQVQIQVLDHGDEEHVSSDGGLRRLLRGHLPQVHWTTIESRSTERGIPDIEGCHQGISFWLECKVTHGWTVTMRPGQVAWLLRRSRVGGSCAVLVRQRGAGRDDLWMAAGWSARELRAGGLEKLPAGALFGRWQGGPTGWDWNAVLAAATGKIRQGKASRVK
jgi:hypothetical protein